jgi:hypothetical protein
MIVELASASMNAIEKQPSNGNIANSDNQSMVPDLIEQIVPKTFREFATAAVDFLKINTVEDKFRHGQPVVVKTRTATSQQIAETANLFFGLANIPIRFLSKMEDWQRWEIDCYHMLNGDAFRAFAVCANGICVEKVPGRSLWDHMIEGTLTRPMVEAAATELRRAHQLWSAEFGGPWSHADATMQNVMYDEKTGRARLIDFEIMHERSLSAPERHADDLVVFLLDLVAKGRRANWLPLAIRFAHTYAVREVIAEIKKHLVVPTGLARIWWNVRTSFANTAKVKRRIELLRNGLDAIQVSSTVALSTDRAVRRRRPSTICQINRPGTPIVSSRTLAIRERAKAVSPEMPRKLPTMT